MNKNSKILLWAGLVVVVAIIFFSTFSGQQSSNEPIRIGVAVGQTGFGQEWGNGEFRAVQLLADKVNKNGGIDGHSLELIVEDTKSDNVGTVNAVTKLVNVDKVPVIIGPTWADSFGGGTPIAENAHVVLISPSAAIEVAKETKNFSYLFSTWWPQLPEIVRLQRFLRDSGLKKVVVINDQDAFNTKISDLFIEQSKSAELNVVGHYVTPIGVNDFRTTLVKAKQLSPDAIFVETQDISEIGPLTKQMRELNFRPKIFSTTSAQNEDLVQKFGSFVEGMIYTYPATESDAAYKKLVQEYTVRYGQPPSGPSFVNAYNAALMVVEALKNGARSGEEIKNQLVKIKIPGIALRELFFNDRGQIGEASFEVRTIKNGKFIKIAD